MIGSVKFLEDRDRDRVYSGRSKVLFHVSHDSLSQSKVELAKLVVPRVAGPHFCEYLSNGTKVLFHGPLIGRDLAGFHKADAHALRKYLEERDGIPDTLGVNWDSQSSSELAPLAPGSGVFLEDGG